MPRGIFGLREVGLCGIHPLTRRYKAESTSVLEVRK